MRALLAVAAGLVLASCVADPGRVASTSGQALGRGEVGTNCALGRADRGTEVATFPTEGRTRWRIHDTAPGSTVPRTQYITGFSDGCARQVTAALLIFGSPVVHETLRYDPAHRVPYDVTDTAYERIKGQICGVEVQVPCPGGQRDKLERTVAFVTVYPTFGATRGLVELLIDSRGVVARSG